MAIAEKDRVLDLVTQSESKYSDLKTQIDSLSIALTTNEMKQLLEVLELENRIKALASEMDQAKEEVTDLKGLLEAEKDTDRMILNENEDLMKQVEAQIRAIIDLTETEKRVVDLEAENDLLRNTREIMHPRSEEGCALRAVGRVQGKGISRGAKREGSLQSHGRIDGRGSDLSVE